MTGWENVVADVGERDSPKWRLDQQTECGRREPGRQVDIGATRFLPLLSFSGTLSKATGSSFRTSSKRFRRQRRGFLGPFAVLADARPSHTAPHAYRNGGTRSPRAFTCNPAGDVLQLCNVVQHLALPAVLPEPGVLPTCTLAVTCTHSRPGPLQVEHEEAPPALPAGLTLTVPAPGKAAAEGEGAEGAHPPPYEHIDSDSDAHSETWELLTSSQCHSHCGSSPRSLTHEDIAEAVPGAEGGEAEEPQSGGGGSDDEAARRRSRQATLQALLLPPRPELALAAEARAPAEEVEGEGEEVEGEGEEGAEAGSEMEHKEEGEEEEEGVVVAAEAALALVETPHDANTPRSTGSGISEHHGVYSLSMVSCSAHDLHAPCLGRLRLLASCPHQPLWAPRAALSALLCRSGSVPAWATITHLPDPGHPASASVCALRLSHLLLPPRRTAPLTACPRPTPTT